MNKSEMRDAILEAKKAKSMTWEAIAAASCGPRAAVIRPSAKRLP